MVVKDSQEPSVGARVLLGGKHKATVRYVGSIDGQQGTWIGIEYDDAERGKHDGSHGGRRYFACSHSQTAGSFVRLNKFLEAADFGRSLVAAVQERYGLGSAGGGSQPSGAASGNAAAAADEDQLYVSTASNRRVAVELLAPEASRRLSAAGGAVAVLVQQAISSVGCGAELQAMLPSLTELDLSDNLIASWSFVAELAPALPSLHTLNLSGNRLALPSLAQATLPPAGIASPLTGLQTLVLNNCGVTWPQAVAAARQLPNLRELHICSNGLTSLQLPADAVNASTSISGQNQLTHASLGGRNSEGSSNAAATLLAAAFSQLEVLDLEDNRLSNWADVALLSQLPALKALLLSGNQLAEVQYSGGFASLRSLLLGSNRLGSWVAADQMDRFPALAEARLSGNPLGLEAPGAARYQAIARISRLTVLNASDVSPAERWDAEVNYLRQVTDELAGAGADQATRQHVLAAHPRFAALTQKYGELAPAAPKAATGSALAASMAQLTICHGTKTLQKKLPVSLTVGKLKLMLERLLRVKAAQQALLLVPLHDSGSQPEDITDDDSRELRYYDVCDGCRLEVSVADPEARAVALAAAKQAAAADHAQRMQQHEKTIQQFRAVEQQLMT